MVSTERNPTGANTTLRTKIDQLKFIDAYANALFASPRVIRAEKMTRVSSSNPNGRMSYSPCPLDGIATRPESSIARIDYYALDKKVGFFLRVSLESYLSVMWGTESLRPHFPRLKKWTHYMEENSDTIALVEGSFRLNSVSSMLVLAMLRYSPDEPERERYSVLSSIFHSLK
jgi:hypothetical protein